MNGHCGRLGMVCLAWACLLPTGCATLHFPWEKPVPHASVRNPVMQITCLWEVAEGKDPEGKPCRGFAGQVFFIGNKKGTPVAVDGKVRVKQFDQFTGPAESNEPFYQFDFEGKAWEIHRLDGTMGPSYNVFIPYMRKGNHEAQCELVVEFTPDDGSQMVASSITSLVLHSKQSAKDVAKASAAKSLLPTSANLDDGRGVRTTTIPLDGSKPKGDMTPREQEMAAQIERMERKLDQFAAQQAAKAANPMAALQATPDVTPPPTRFSMAPGKIVQASAATVAAAEPVAQASGRIPVQGRPQNFLSAHPLASEEAHGPTPAETATIAQKPARRHPLADEPAFANEVRGLPSKQAAARPPSTLVVPEELTDAPAWMREENNAGKATLSDDLDGQTSQVP